MNAIQLLSSILLITLTMIVLNYNKIKNLANKIKPRAKVELTTDQLLTTFIKENNLREFIKIFRKLKIDPNSELVVTELLIFREIMTFWGIAQIMRTRFPLSNF